MPAERKTKRVSKRKACFFDIDGTIWDVHNRIPESTVRAIRTLRSNGHLAFLNSGRCKGYIRHPDLLGIGFDGIVCGCGTMVEYHDEVIFCHLIDNDFLADTLRLIRGYGFRTIMEGPEHLYMDEEEFKDDRYGREVMREMGDMLRSIEDEWGRWRVCKFSCATDVPGREECFEKLLPDYDLMIHNEAVAEIVPKGFHKGTGLLKVCELLSIDPADTFAFGDSMNDLGMLESAGTGIVMGDGSPGVKEKADYVTSSMMEDGIWNACRHFGLV